MFEAMAPENAIIMVLLVLGVIPLVLFIVRYFFFSPWRAEPEGRTMMYQKIALLAVLLLALAARALGPEYWGREVITILVYTVIVYFFWRTLFELLSVQRQYPFSRIRLWREKRKRK